MAAVRPTPPQTDAALDDAGQLYREIAESIPLMVWTARPDGSVNFVNQRVVDYTGVEASQLAGWNWQAVIHPEDWERCVAIWTRSLQAGERSENEMRLLRADGKYRWHHGTGIPMRDAEGRLVRWFGICTDIEDQVRSTQALEALVEERTLALRESEQRFQQFMDHLPALAWIRDANFRYVYVNQAFARFRGMAVADMIGQTPFQFEQSKDAEVIRESDRQVLAKGEPVQYFDALPRGQWLKVKFPLRGPEGEMLVAGIALDITDRAKLEDALRESEQRFQQFMDHLPAQAWIRDAQFRFTYVNRICALSFGVEPEAMIGRKASQFLPAALSARFRETDRTVREEGKPMQFVDGMPTGRWLKVKFPLPAADRESDVAGIALDVSERSRLEDALLAVEQRFRFFMENAPAVAWIKDSALRYTYVSGPYETQVGKTRSELLGHDDFEVWPEELARVYRENDEKVIRSGKLVQTFETSARPGGVEQKWLVIKFPLADATGRNGVAGMGVDITERVDAEEKVRHYAEEIRELMNRLVTTQEMERRRLADNLHDLIGQNLTALGIELGALKAGISGESQKTAMPRLDVMAGLVNDTIQSIRGVMTELRPPALEEFGLVPALRSHVAAFGERTGMKVRLNVSGQGARLPRDIELTLFRIMQEALTNAAKHSGGTSVEIAVTEFAGGLRLSVHDDGTGFDHRKGARGARRGGWGLPAMRERAEAHGGTLRIEFPARGTRLIVEIPGTHAD